MLVLSESKPDGQSYGLQTVPPQTIAAAAEMLVGCVWMAAGQRSPESGMRTSARHEIGYVVEGRVKIETLDQTLIAKAGDMLVMCPAEMHSTTALEDSQIFFVLLDPTLASC